MKCPRCEELEEQVAYLKSELGLQIDAAQVVAVKRLFAVPQHKARLLLVLYQANGRPVSAGQFDDALPKRYGDAERCVSFPNSTVSQIRKSLGFDVIETVHGRGYRLSDAARARIAEVLSAGLAAAIQRGQVAA